MKTAKFSDVVKACGEPSIYLAWMNPAKDKALKRALTENRVMTLHQELHGGKKDFGSVGFLKDRHAQLLVFPKSLQKFSDRKIVAINYSLITEGALSAGTFQSGRPERRSGQKRAAAAQLSQAQKPLGEIAAKITVVTTPDQKVRGNNSTQKAAEIGKFLTEVRQAIAELSTGRPARAEERLRRLLACGED